MFTLTHPARLVSDRVNAPIHHLTIILLYDDINRVFTLAEIHRHTPRDLFCCGEPFGNAINDEDFGSSPQRGGIGGHEADGAGAKDGNSFAGLKIGEGDTVPASGKDVGEEGEGGFVLCTRREGESVEVGEGDTEVLCLGVVGG